MTSTTPADDPSPIPRTALTAVLATLVIAAAITSIFWPVPPMALTGDSYQWIQHAHRATHQPAFLLTDLDTFYRPSTTWSLVADRLIWGGFNAPGYRTSSLALHGLVALALILAGRRLGLGRPTAIAVGLMWATSPFADESALVVAYRFQPLLLLSWLGLIAVWPRREERWTPPRLVIAFAIVVLAAFSKETWVMTPILVAVLEFERRRSLRAAVIPTIFVGCAVVVYVIWYFSAFPGSKSYYDLGPHIAAKIPSQLAAFLYLEESSPVDPSLTWVGILATLATAAVVLMCLKHRVAGTLVALCIFVLPTIPTIAVPFMPQRYLAIPYAGFLLLAALWITFMAEAFPRSRRAIRVAAIAAVALVVAVGASVVRGDIEDYREMAAAHERLLAEAGEAVSIVTSGARVGVVLDHQGSPLHRLASSLAGYPKLFYVRPNDPYGLIDTAAMFEWVAGDEGRRVENLDETALAGGDREGVVLIHSRGGFVERGRTQNLHGELIRWRESGRATRAIQTAALN